MWQENDRQMFLNTAGNSAMAKAGSGDVLAGVITGLLAQHMKVYEGTVLGVYLHACGGDAARERRGAYSVLAEDLTEGIAACIKKTERGDNDGKTTAECMQRLIWMQFHITWNR